MKPVEAPEFTDQEIEGLKGLVPDYLTRPSFFGTHLKRILEKRQRPDLVLSNYHKAVQWGLKKFMEQELSH